MQKKCNSLYKRTCIFVYRLTCRLLGRWNNVYIYIYIYICVWMYIQVFFFIIIDRWGIIECTHTFSSEGQWIGFVLNNNLNRNRYEQKILGNWIYIYIYIYIHTHIHTYIYIYIYIYVCVCVCVCVYIL